MGGGQYPALSGLYSAMPYFFHKNQIGLAALLLKKGLNRHMYALLIPLQTQYVVQMYGRFAAFTLRFLLKCFINA
jgi:hypothetical protein